MRNVAAWLVLAIASFVWLPGAPADAASFNCRPYLKKAQCPEMVICSEPVLSALDTQMAELYQEILGQLSGRKRTEFRNEQKDFLRYRNECGCNYDCLEQAYRETVKSLGKTTVIMNNERGNSNGNSYGGGSSIARPIYCRGAREATVQAVCASSDLLRFDADLNAAYKNVRRGLSRSDKSSLKNSQRAWLRQRNDCGRDFDCIKTVYEDRIYQLDNGDW